MGLRPRNPELRNVLDASKPISSHVTHGEKPFGSDVEGIIVRDTFFSRELRSWLVSGSYGHDKEFLDVVNTAVLSNIKKMVSLQMSLDDLGNSMVENGIEDFDMSGLDALRRPAENLLAINTIRDIMAALDFDKPIADEIVLREVESRFGTAQRMARERANEEETDRKLMASMHNAMERTMKAVESLVDVQRRSAKEAQAKAHKSMPSAFKPQSKTLQQLDNIIEDQG